MNTHFRTILYDIFEAGLRAVAPDGALLRHARLDKDILYLGHGIYPLAGKKLTVLGGGKGAAPMALALENLLGDRISDGLIVVKYAHGLPLRRIRQLEAGHPVPDAAGMAATQTLLRMAAEVDKNDCVICVFTGGASALTPAPVEGVSLEDLQQTTSLLLECGATIDQLNAVRKHLSRFSGGHLARICQPARVCSVIVSDVVGDALDVIASGPTVPDVSSFADCWRIVEQFSLTEKLPAPVRERLLAGCRGHREETPKPGDSLFHNVDNVLVATNRQALEAAATRAREHGYIPRILTDAMTGEAREQGQWLAREALSAAQGLRPDDAPLCLLAGGETTVTLRGQGKGGRNQEMALAASLALEGEPRVAALFAGTDGSDGPTDAAGGYAFGDSAVRLREHGDPRRFLDANNSYAALHLSGDLLITGPTRTNVMDMALLLVSPPKE